MTKLMIGHLKGKSDIIVNDDGTFRTADGVTIPVSNLKEAIEWLKKQKKLS
jgi:hypothetical protein